jgi:hypothetical protein
MLRKALMRRSEGRRSRHEELVKYNFKQMGNFPRVMKTVSLIKSKIINKINKSRALFTSQKK